MKICAKQGCNNKVNPNFKYCVKHEEELNSILGIRKTQRRKAPSQTEKITLVECPACSKKISPNADVCINCGHPMNASNTEERNEKEIKCPNCNSGFVKRISKKSKVGSAIAFGIFSMGKLIKTYECKDCKYRW